MTHTHACLFRFPVGFHRFILENFTGETLDGVKEHEVAEFDAASEVRWLIYIHLETHTRNTYSHKVLAGSRGDRGSIPLNASSC